MEPLARIVAAAGGVLLVILTIRSVIRTFVLPRMARDTIVQFVFHNVRRLFDLVAGPRAPYATRDRYLAYFAPVALLALPVINLVRATRSASRGTSSMPPTTGCAMPASRSSATATSAGATSRAGA